METIRQREKRRAYMREWMRKHRAQHPEARERGRTATRRWRAAHREEALAASERWFRRYKEEHGVDYKQRWRQKNRERYNAKEAKRLKEKYHTDPEFRKKKLEAVKAWRLANPEKKKAQNRSPKQKVRDRKRTLKQYGLTHEAYDELLKAQSGVCAICKRVERNHYKGKPRSLHVDHDHKSGKRRGLLCSACNPVLGLAGDDAEILRRAADYLEWWHAVHEEGRVVTRGT